MRNTTGDKPLGTRAQSKARVREVAHKVGNSALSLILALSMVPAPSIAYALGEDDEAAAVQAAEAVAPGQEQQQQPVEEPAPAPETPAVDDQGGTQEPVPAEEPQTEPVVEPEQPAADQGQEQGTPQEQTPVTDEQPTEQKPAEEPKADEQKPAEETKSDEQKPAQESKTDDKKAEEPKADTKDSKGESKSDAKATDTETTVAKKVAEKVEAKKTSRRTAKMLAEGEVKATITVPGEVHDGKVYSKDHVTATVKVEHNIKDFNITGVSYPGTMIRNFDFEGSGDTWTFTTKGSVADGKEVTFTLPWIMFYYNYTEGSETKSASVTATVANGVTAIVVDKKAPEVTASFTEGIAEVGADTSDAKNPVKFFDVKQGQRLQVILGATDADFNNNASKATMRNLRDSDGSSSSFNEFVFAGNGTSTVVREPQNFYDNNGNLRRYKVTVHAEDYAGNVTTEIVHDGKTYESLSFTSDSYALTKTAYELSVDPSVENDVATRNGKTVYRKDVNVKFAPTGNDAAKYAGSIDASNTYVDVQKNTDDAAKLALDSDGKATVAAVEGENNTYVVTSHIKTKHGVEGTSTVKNFSIDTTVPVVESATLSGSSVSATNPMYFGKSDTPKLTVNLKANTDSTLAETDPYLIQLFNSKTGEEVTTGFSYTKNADGTYNLKVPESADPYYVKVSPKTIFGETLEDVATNAASTDTFIYDAAAPDITVSFSGPSASVTQTVGKITGFFKDPEATEEELAKLYEGAGAMTIKVSDVNLEESGINLDTTKLQDNGDATATKWVKSTEEGKTVFTLVVPYIKTDTEFYFLGESGYDKVHTVSLDATDLAGNKSKPYSYTATEEGILDGSDPAGFAVDTESPDIQSITLNGVGTATTYGAKVGGTEVAVDAYGVASATAEVKVYDAHFNTDSSQVKLVTVTNGTASEPQKVDGNWTDNNDGTYTFTVPADKLVESSGTDNVFYRIDVQAVDSLGNADSKKSSNYFAFDATKPEVEAEVRVGGSVVSPGGTVDGIDYYKEDEVTVVVTAADASFINVDGLGNKSAVPTGIITYTDNSGNHTIAAADVAWTWVTDHYEATVATFGQNKSGTTYVATATDVADLLGNKDTATTGNFRVDNKPPVVQSVTMSETSIGVNEADKADYYLAATTATITVYDANFNLDTASSLVTVPESTGATWDGTWDISRASEGIYTTTVAFGETPANKVSNFTIDAVDFAGYHAIEKTAYGDWFGAKNLVVDLDKPEIKVEFDKAPVGTVDGIDYFDNSTVAATITVTDKHFDAANSPVVDANKKAAGTTISDWQNTSGDVWVAKAIFNEVNRHAVWSDLTIDYQDKACTVLSSITGHNGSWDYETGTREGQTTSGSKTFILDSTQPTVKVEMSEAVKQTIEVDGKVVDFYNSTNDDNQLVATITVVDNNLDTTKKVADYLLSTKGAAKVDEDWTTTDNQTYTAKVYYEENASVYDPSDLAAEVWDLVFDAAGSDTTVQDRHFDETDYRDDHVTVTLADEGAAQAEGFVLDVTAPKVEVDLDQQMVGNLDKIDYYDTKAKLTATVTVTDNNFDTRNESGKSPIKLTQTDKDGNEVEVQGELAQDWKQDGTSNKWTAVVTFDETKVDTKQAFNLVARDYATNKTAYAYGDNKAQETDDKGNVTTGATSTKDVDGAKVNGPDLVIDVHTPTIKVVFDKTPVGAAEAPNGTTYDYYDNAAVKATITVTDNNFDASKSVVTDANKSKSGSVISGWTQQDGDKANQWVATVDFSEVDAASIWSDLNIDFQDKVQTAADKASKSTNTVHKDNWNYEKGASIGTGKTAGAGKFILDTIAPTVKVAIDQPIQRTFNNTDFYGNVVKMTITVVDNNFDTNATTFTPTQTDKVKDSGSWKKAKDGKTYTRTFTFSENDNISKKSDLLLDIRDMVYTASSNKKTKHHTTYNYRQANNANANAQTTVSGNKEDKAAKFVVDMSAPSMDSVSIGHDPAYSYDGKEFFNIASSMTFKFSDANGLDSIVMVDPDGEYSRDDKATSVKKGATSGTYTIALVEGKTHDQEDFEREITVTVTDLTGNWRQWTMAPTGKVKSVKAGTKDNAPVDGRHPVLDLVDTVAPVIALSDKAVNGQFFNTDVTINGTITEHNFGRLHESPRSGEVVINIYTAPTADSQATTPYATVSVADFTNSDPTATWSRVFSEDGHYYLVAEFKDIAMNQSNRDELGVFTVDKTAPVINSITWDNNDVRNGKYYMAARTATITVTEHNWDPAKEGSFITTNGTIGGWSHNGDTHTATVTFATDGDYNLSCQITDKAGNTSPVQTEPEFTVDLQKPTITISAVDNATAYGDVVAPVLTFQDEKNFSDVLGENGYSFELKGAKHGVVDLETVSEAIANGRVVTWADILHSIEYDDIYTLTAHLVDLAGNETSLIVDSEGNEYDGEEKVFTFSVNRFGSTFRLVGDKKFVDELDKADKEEREAYFAAYDDATKDSIDMEKVIDNVVVQEINVTGAQSQNCGVKVSHGLDTDDLEAIDAAPKAGDEKTSAGFFLDRSKDSDGWSEYTYNIYGGNFKEDGNYTVVVRSTDEAGNLNDSTSFNDPDDPSSAAEVVVGFVMDTQDPIIDNVNLEDDKTNNGRKDELKTLTFDVNDNIGVDAVTVRVDGEELPQAEVEAGDNGDGSYSVHIDPKFFTDRTLEIVATDVAGRTTKVDYKRFRYTTNIFELYWPFITAGAAAVGGGGYAYGSGRKRRKNEGDPTA